MIVSDSSYKMEYASAVLGLVKPGDIVTKSLYVYNNNSEISFLLEGDNLPITEEWVSFRCVGSSIDWTTLDGETAIDLGSWSGYRLIEIKITCPSDAEQGKYDYTFKINSEEMNCYIAVNYEFILTALIDEAVFGIKNSYY